jgi:hypothetical protein
MTARLEPLVDDSGVDITSRRNLYLVLGAAGLLIGALLTWTFLGGSSTGETDTLQVASAEEVEEQEEAPDEVEAPDVDADVDEGAPLPVVTYEVYLERDPFDPVVPEEEPAPTETDVSPDDDDNDRTVTDPDDPRLDRDDPRYDPRLDPDDPRFDPTDPRLDPDRNDDNNDNDNDDNDDDRRPRDPSDADACRGGNQEAVCDGRVVSLLEVDRSREAPTAIVQVDTSVYEVRRGDTFAERFSLTAINGDCVTLLYGDDGFQLCAGDQVLK